MKKTLPFSLLFGLGILSLVTAALSSFVFVSYSTAEGEEVLPPLENSGIVAESYYGDEETPFASYRSLPEALEDANSKAAAGSEVNVYLVPGQGDVTVSNAHLVVDKGVSLYLPYEGKKWDRDDTGDTATDISAIKGSGFADKDAAGVASNRKNHLVLHDSTLEIESGAALYVGGLFKTKGVCSSYAEITLDSSSSILVAGSFTNYGYVKTVEDSSDAVSSFAPRALQGEEDDRPEVRVFSGASVHTYIAVYDSLSNSLLVSLNSAGVCPVNAFDFPALQAPFTFESGSRLSAQMRMVMSVAGMQEAVDDAASVIAPSGEQSLFNLTSGEITLEYRPEVPASPMPTPRRRKSTCGATSIWAISTSSSRPARNSIPPRCSSPFPTSSPSRSRTGRLFRPIRTSSSSRAVPSGSKRAEPWKSEAISSPTPPPS